MMTINFELSFYSEKKKGDLRKVKSKGKKRKKKDKKLFDDTIEILGKQS